MSIVIKPTVGRVVLFHPVNKPNETCAALICYVHSDRMVNLAAFDCNGCLIQGTTSVPLVQEGDECPNKNGYWCEWMPYQKGQAAKTEELEKKLSSK